MCHRSRGREIAGTERSISGISFVFFVQAEDGIRVGRVTGVQTCALPICQLERELGKLLRKTATRIVAGDVEPPVQIDLELVRDALGRQRFFQESAERTAVPGVATGLAVTGTGGDVLF